MTTNLFEQFAQPTSKIKVTSDMTIRPSTTGFIQMKLREEAPMFSKKKVNFAPPDRITHLVVSNDVLVLAMANQRLLRIDLQRPEELEEIDLSKALANQLHLTGLYLDPMGKHLLLSTGSSLIDQPQLLYLGSRSLKIKQTSKCRGFEVTAVAWSFDAGVPDVTTGPILLGTSKGVIYETELRMDEDRIFGGSLDQYLKPVFDIGRGIPTPITGLEFHPIPRTDKYFILVTTVDRLYEFVGSITNMNERPFLQQIFNNYLNKTEAFHTIKSKLKNPKLQFYYPEPHLTPTKCAWLVEPGLYCMEIDMSLAEAEGRLISGQELIFWQQKGPESPSVSGKDLIPCPLSFVLTQFHALLLYSDHVKGVSLLNHAVVFEDVYSDAQSNSFGKLVNITKDPTKGTIWVFTERAVFKYKVTKEDRNVWQVYVEKGEFELAKLYCENNPVYLDQVLVRQAEMHFKNEEFEKSAVLYAQTHSSFEELALKFLQAWKLDALKLLLREKLLALESTDQTQITMLVMWVLELFMNQLGRLRDVGNHPSTEYTQLQTELDSFLSEKVVKKCVTLHRQKVYNLIASHGDTENLVKLATENKDYGIVIRHHLNKGSYCDALEVLKRQKGKELFYEFAAPLMQAVPKHTVDALISQGHTLVPAKILPALIACDLRDAKAGKEAIRYLEYCVRSLNTHDKAFHNYLLMLYVKFQPSMLMSYLVLQGEDASLVAYDPHYALRLCREHNLNEACVRLSALLGLWESAVDLALTVTVDLAKQIAAKPHTDIELQKKLWLKIAKHVVRKKNDIKQAMEFLQQCPLVKIEDILPFFSDFVTIDHFKDAICTSLQEYNQHIQDLKDEMVEATKSAELVRGEINSFRNRYTVVKSRETCSECSLQLLLRPFYLFPCGHSFHSDCLLNELLPALPSGKRNKLTDLQRQLASLTSREDTASVSLTSLSTRDQLKSDIDSIVAAECLYCGEEMIRSIDRPFVGEEDYEKVMKEWQ